MLTAYWRSEKYACAGIQYLSSFSEAIRTEENARNNKIKFQTFTFRWELSCASTRDESIYIHIILISKHSSNTRAVANWLRVHASTINIGASMEYFSIVIFDFDRGAVLVSRSRKSELEKWWFIALVFGLWIGFLLFDHMQLNAHFETQTHKLVGFPVFSSSLEFFHLLRINTYGAIDACDSLKLQMWVWIRMAQ